VDPSLAEAIHHCDLSFREESHAIEAVLAGQGVAICSDIVLERELRSGAIVKAHDLSLPGYGYYLVHLPDHPRLPAITDFATWVRSLN
jgi:LysR family glycine cleavage system transcriptional activator